MKKEIRTIHEASNTVQVTIADERWYGRTVLNASTGLPEVAWVPSVTWIAGYYPKGIGFYKWLADKGWDEAEAIKSAAGDKGSRVHRAIVDLLDGETVAMEAKYAAGDEPPQELSLEEYDCLRSFRDFWVECEPETIVKERVVFNDAKGYAGTLDWFGWFHKPPKGLSKGPWLIDWKTSQYVWPEHRLQVSAYAESDDMQECFAAITQRPEWAGIDIHLGILQLGYRKNKAGWKLTEVENQFPLFEAARQMWANECADIAPFRRDYPLSLRLPSPERRNG